MRKFAGPRSKKRSKSRPRRQLAKRALLRIEGEAIPITLRTNPRAQRLIVKVHPSTGEVTVVAPSSRALAHALDFAKTESDWIAKRLAHVPTPVPLGLGKRILFRGEEHVIRYGEGGTRPVWIERDDDGQKIIRVAGRAEHAARRLQDFLKREARRLLDARTTLYAEMIEAKPKRITVRDTASRWGSCSSGRMLSFSWRLVLAPPFVLDYVVAHEVAHLREMNHGTRFWRLLETMVADVEKPQAWLNANGAQLHRYAPRISALA